jgi:hypothetical protein
MGTEFGRLAQALEAFPGDGTQHQAIEDGVKKKGWTVKVSLTDDVAHDLQDTHTVYEFSSHKSNPNSNVVTYMYRIGKDRWVEADRIMGVRVWDKRGIEQNV